MILDEMRDEKAKNGDGLPLAPRRSSLTCTTLD